MCFGKRSCCGSFMPAPKINTPINTVAAPCNCVKEAFFVNLLLKTWTEMRLLNPSVGALRARARASALALLPLCGILEATHHVRLAAEVRLRKPSELSVRAANVRWISDVFS